MPEITWPEGKRFAFSVFDDTDHTTMENGPPVYALLAELGLRTTKSVWPMSGEQPPVGGGATCDDAAYAAWVKGLQEQGFEIGIHGVTGATATREEWKQGLDRFRDLFGHYPLAHANHVGCLDSVYWGEQRLTGLNKLVYNMLTRYRNRQWQGERPDSPCFWGDYCKTHIRFVRNFVFAEVNTLKACPEMPYRDPDRPFVNAWFASSEGPNVRSFNRTLSEANQEKLEAEGGACIMYTHFGADFVQDRQVEQRFASLMKRLSQRPGWFVPVSQLLDHIAAMKGGTHVITPSERRKLERRWLAHKVRIGGTS